ncbi:peptidoglycan DD-metalloendopeptidase family protein [Shewanella sp. AS16]|uniref:peptidoglycan DD-metalloendopeptidase family protein n=1 Tax=Shewanella sp. AS16 TaxID=2907625 RepID=UPI001F205104|nr:peptidoglycan DD-metalloendopeptidase family protein [Shewanella sp. AS16]MCE9686562.1 peptidoglycan DD-metalloendopeptidase family protein [Shewanella sp. AS16]
MLSGCSFQARRPAPVENVYLNGTPTYDRGSIKTGVYTVKKGDTLYSISWGAGKDFVTIAKLNKLAKPYTIYPGQKLKLQPGKRSWTKKKPYTVRHTAKAGTQKTAKTTSNKTPKPATNTQTTQTSSTKKVLDHKVKPAYSVTGAQQVINKSIHSASPTLPARVSRWRWPVRGDILSTFSANEQGNKGIKIAGNRGTVINAAADGRVVYAGSALRGYGNLVIIKHSDDYLSAYAHADKILVKEKQQVVAGQRVATMGSTGTDRVMLHFEIRYHGKSVNPLKYLPKH